MTESPPVGTEIRTYAGRSGRLSALARERLDRFLPARALPPGPLMPVEAFGREAPVVLDIGCGHGAAAIAYASTHLAHDVLAVDVHVPGMARLLAAAEAAGVANMRVEIGDAVGLLTDRVKPGQLAAVHLFFPDPWPKLKHAKRRFVRASTLDLLASRLAAGGHVLIATDQPAYAEHVRTEVRTHGRFVVVDVPRPPWRPMDGFECKGVAAGRTVVDLRLDRR
ncbi:MAG TPA: methyltransferase domain-containing protein [Lapillicoccus sp.]|jgi:tRNA (guanine-N7-)-methyltransferase|nr:methyltransferase domain-containing protein [Lapillicoccus sp.]